jgi:hypothetical protein
MVTVAIGFLTALSMPSWQVGGTLQNDVRSPSEPNIAEEADLRREELRSQYRARTRLELAGMVSMSATILGGLGLIGGLLLVRAELRDVPRRTASGTSCAGAPIGTIAAVRERINCG